MLRLLAVGVVMAAPCVGNAVAKCVKTVRWSDDAPYSFKLPGGEIFSFDSDQIRSVLKELNCEARLVELPWARALGQGRPDIFPGALRAPERETFAYFSRPVHRSPNMLFVAKSAAAKYRLRALTDIHETAFQLGAQIDVVYGADLDAPVKTPVFA